MPKQLKKFCRLTNYLASIDKDLYQTFDDLCMFSLFRTRGGRGVTFLYPADASYRKKITDMAYSNTPEKAVDMIKALVLMDFLPKPVDFKNKKDDIPNSLRKKLEVEDVDSKEVKLKGGLKLTPDAGFVPLRSDDPVAVYKLSGKGELSITGAPATMKYSQMAAKRGGGRYHGGAEGLKSVAKAVVEKYKSGKKDIYKILLAYVYKQALQPENAAFLKHVYDNMCATERATFYNVLQPYSAENNANVPESIRIGLKTIVEECEQCDVTHFLQKWKDNRDALIKKGRGGDGSFDVVKDLYKKKYDEQCSLLQSSKTALAYSTNAKNAYGSDSSKMSSDLLSMYSYLAAMKEVEGDAEYYEHGYIWAMEYCYKNKAEILTLHNNTASHITLFGNLLKSDAFKYIPTCSNESPQTSTRTPYQIIKNYLPEPTQAAAMFSIEKSPTKEYAGGSDLSSMV